MKENLSELEALLSRFYSELLERGYSKSTYYAYRSAGGRLVKWCDKNAIYSYDEDVGKRFCEYVKLCKPLHNFCKAEGRIMLLI